MKTTCCIFLVSLLFFSTTLIADAAPPSAGPTLPPGVKLIPNLEYANVGGKSLLMDLYLPAAIDKPIPVILYVHGGGWMAGDKQEGRMGIPMVAHGYALASIDYRLSADAVFPAQIQDCKAAVRWLRAHAKFYGLNPAHIGAWGASAGGHLVALLGTTGSVKNLEGDEGNLEQSSEVEAVCDWFGPTDMSKIVEELKQSGIKDQSHADAADSPVARLLGGSLQDNLDKSRRANPIAYITKAAAPTLIMHGDKDDIVPLAQSEIFRDALQKAGVDAKLDVVRGAGHGFGTPPEVMKSVEDFFDAHLKHDVSATAPAAKG